MNVPGQLLNLAKGGKGERAFRALLRYIAQHGNVTRNAKLLAEVFREAIGDEVPPVWDGFGGVTFSDTGKSPVQELDEACAALKGAT